MSETLDTVGAASVRILAEALVGSRGAHGAYRQAIAQRDEASFAYACDPSPENLRARGHAYALHDAVEAAFRRELRGRA